MKSSPNINIEITIGLPFTHYLALSTSDGVEVDPTGDTFTASMVTWIGKTAVEDFVCTVSNDDNGTLAVKMAMDSTATSGLTAGVYRWDCIMTDVDTGDRMVIAQGNANVYDTATTP